MGGGAGGGRELDQTPTWAVAAVCAVIVVISIALEKVLHHVGEYFQEKRKKALFEALEKIKGELMVLGFISLLLTFGQNFISNICIREELASTMLPCQWVSHSTDSANLEPSAEDHEGEHHRRLLWNEHRVLAADSPPAGCKAGQLPLISVHGLHQLHIFIFFLAVFHVIYSAITMMLGRLKIRGWKDWEREVLSREEATRDPARFRLTHETSFVRENASFWIKTPFLFYITCFFRQFFRSVRRSDYLTLRHGFINVHLAPGSKFDFQKYIKRSLEDDFKVVVGISPLLWASAVFFLLVNVDTWQAMTWLSLLPLLVILAVGTKLQAIIAAMAVEITERHAVVQGMPLIQVSDSYFWLSWPQLILYLIHYVLFQNAFEITYFFWIWYEFGLRSCFHSNFPLTITRVALGITVQITCSYITLPLYALVTQMGSNMKQSIFDEQTSKALRNWRKNAKKKNEGKPGGMPTQTLGESGDAEADTPGQEQEMAKVTATVDLEEKLSPPRDLLTGS
ncbi:MLO-like protein [Drosera capensis]